MGLIANMQRSIIERAMPDQAGADPKRYYQAAFPLGWSTDVPTPQDYARLVDSYKSWVYVCASKNGRSVAEATQRLYLRKTSELAGKKSVLRTKSVGRKTEDRLRKNPMLTKMLSPAEEIEEVLEHPYIDLMSSINPFRNRFETMEETELFLELCGNSYWYVVRNKLSLPAQIWTLPAQNVRVVPSADKFISGYVYLKGAYKIPFDPEEIIHFKFSNPNNMHYGLGPLSAIYSAYQFHESTRRFETALMANMGRPEGILTYPEELDEVEFKRIRKEWVENYGGVGKVGKVLILSGGTDYKPITMSPKEMSYLAGLKITREEIAGAFDIPMSKLTMESSNRAVADSGDYQYANEAIEPRLRRIEEKLNEALIPSYDENLFVAYDSTVPEDKDFMLRERESNIRSFYSSINLERDRAKEDHVDWGDVPWAPMGLAPLGAEPPAPPEIPGGVMGTSGTAGTSAGSSGTSGTGGTSGLFGEGKGRKRW